MLNWTSRTLVLSIVITLTGCLYRISSSNREPLSSQERTAITGIVVLRNTGEPLRHAIVTLCDDVRLAVGCTSELSRSRTDENGKYDFQCVPPGSYVPAVRLSGKIYVANLRKAGDSPFLQAIRYAVQESEVTHIPDIRIAEAPGKAIPIDGEDETVPLVSPKPGQCVNSRPTLEWKAVSGASGYLPELWRIDGPKAGEIELRVATVTGRDPSATRFKVPIKLEDGFYRWKVSAITAGTDVNRPKRKRPEPAGDQEGFFTVAGSVNRESRIVN